MSPEFDILDIDWNNSDVEKVVEFFQGNLAETRKENAELKASLGETRKENAELKASLGETRKENAELKAELQQLKDEFLKLKMTKHNSRTKSKSYNTRELKGYPHPKNPPKKRPPPRDVVNTVQRTADLKFCPIHGTPISKQTSQYDRTVEDVVDGKWCSTEWTVVRRYCTKCRKQHSAEVENVLPHEHFGTAIMSQIAIMRCLGIPYGKMQTLIEMVYGRYIETSTLTEICNSVSDKCRPLYDNLMASLTRYAILFGDETGWFLNGKTYWVWVFITSDTILFHLGTSRSKMVAEAILEQFEGITISDSHSGWNDVGNDHQKCLLHYFRDMYRTIKHNDSTEFKSFFDNLYKILKSAIALCGKYDDKDKISKRQIDKLQARIDKLAWATYEDKDCRRYAKRLKREGRYLLTFLKHKDVPYHNNTSERAVRIFALMRKIFYGNRTMRGVETTETLNTTYATCKLRGTNPYHFIMDFLNGKVDSIPTSKQAIPIDVAA